MGARRQHDREPALRGLVEAEADRRPANLEALLMTDHQRLHGADRARAAALIAEHGAERVERPARRGNREADPFAGRRVPEVEDGAADRRVVRAARDGRPQPVTRDYDQALLLRRTSEEEPLPGEQVRLRLHGSGAGHEQAGQDRQDRLRDRSHGDVRLWRRTNDGTGGIYRQPRRVRAPFTAVAPRGTRAHMGVGIVMQATGGPEMLRAEAHDPGPPGPATARVRVAAAGVNFIDVYFRSGAYPAPLPFVLGLEGAGEVEAVGPDVRDLAPGDRVAWAAVPGSYATAVVAPVDRLVRVPEGVTLEVAAAAMLQGMTAHYLAHGTRETRPGDTALVHAAAGGVGLLLVQTLRAAGARVIGTCSTAAKEALAREAGAHEVIRYGEADFADEVRRLTAGRGVDVVYDGVGRTTFDGSLRSLRVRGLCVLYGQSSGAVPPLDLQRLNQGGSLSVTRPSLQHYTQDRAELEHRAGAVLGAIAAGKLHVRVGARFPLAEAAAAHRALEGRATTGKVLLLP